MPSLIALPLFFSFFLFSFSVSTERGEELYQKLCSSCHGQDRLGLTAPPLIPETFKRKEEAYLRRVIKKGIPASGMPAFPSLTQQDLKALTEFINRPVGGIKYDLEDIKKTHQYIKRKPASYEIKDFKNLIVAVDKGGEVLLLEGTGVLDRFPFANVHGGVKFSGKRFYVPARSGWVVAYDLEQKKPIAKVRACLYLRNITTLPGDRGIAAACVLPRSLVILDRDLKPLKALPLRGRPSAVYRLYKHSALVLTFRDQPYAALYKGEKISYFQVRTPLEDFFIDPFEEYLLGTSREEKALVAYTLPDFREVFSESVESLPHLFSGAFWYRKGKFLFATRHVDGKLSIWELYTWKRIKTLPLKEKGFFVRTHYKNHYLWLDAFSPGYLLLSKKNLTLREVKISGRGILTHVEFSGDGRLAYLSRLGEEPALVIIDANSFKEIKEIPLKHPAGKYNVVLKTRRFLPAGLGYEVYMEKCWGCHHTTREAFAPPFRWIAQNRPRSLIIAQILNPDKTYRLLGYEENAMPKIELSRRELEALLEFMEVLKDGWMD